MPPRINAPQRRVIFLSSLGGMLEFYDFVIFAVFAIPIGQSFFPSSNPLLEMMAAFAAFAVGYLARPLGGVLFSHFGDKYGRKKSFIVSIIIMGLATLAMGILPSYHQYGISMSILFLTLRVVQGIAVGGEIPGAITYVTEHVKLRPATACGIIFSFLNIGILLAHLFDAGISFVLPYINYPLEVWRIAFIIGGMLAIISYFLRTSLEESPEYLNFQHEVHEIPLLKLCSHHKKALVIACLIVAIQATLISIIYLYSASFMQLTKLYSLEEIAWVNIVGLSVFCFTNVLWGYISDIKSPLLVLKLGALLLIPCSYYFYQGLLFNQSVLFKAVIMAFVSGMTTGSFAAIIASLFPTQVRYSGIALSYNLAFAVFAGLSPLLATSLIQRTHNMMMPAFLMMIMAGVGFIASLFAKQIKNHINID